MSPKNPKVRNFRQVPQNQRNISVRLICFIVVSLAWVLLASSGALRPSFWSSGFSLSAGSILDSPVSTSGDRTQASQGASVRLVLRYCLASLVLSGLVSGSQEQGIYIGEE